MRRHLISLNATKSRNIVLSLFPLTILAIVINSVMNHPYNALGEALPGILAVSSFILVLLISNWIGDDLDKNISIIHIYKNSDRFIYIKQRFIAIYLVTFFVNVLYFSTALFLYPPREFSEILSFFNQVLVSFVYVSIASVFAFLYSNGTGAVLSVLFVVFFFENILNFFISNKKIVELVSVESHISDISSGAAGIGDYIFCLLVVASSPLLSYIIFKRKLI